MLTDLTNTTTADIRAALARIRDQMGGLATGVVLNLIIMTDEASQHDAVRAAEPGRPRASVPGTWSDRARREGGLQT